MPSEFEGSVLAIIRKTKAKPAELLGTGIVLSSGLLLTCAHLFDDLNLKLSGDRRELPARIEVLCGSYPVRPLYASLSGPRDIGCLHFDALPGAVPVRLARVRRLRRRDRNSGITAVGYNDDQSGPCRNIVHDLKVGGDQQSDNTGWLQYGQLSGGLPEGFSGGAVLARDKQEWVAIGMLQLGNKLSAASHFIAVDPIAKFLKEHNIDIAIDEFQPNAAEAERESEGRESGSVNKNIFYGAVTDSEIHITQKNKRH